MQEPIKVGYHLVRFGGDRHSDSEDIIVSVYHFISQDHEIKESRDFIGSSPSR